MDDSTPMQSLAAYEVTFRPVEELIPYARNARTHSPEQVAQIAASITEFGWTNPILADDAGVIAGHGRLMAAHLLRQQGRPIRLPNGRELPEGMVPVIDCTGWSEAQRRAYILADNQLALNAGWDMELLKIELADLADQDFALELIGFDQNFIGELFAPPQIDPPADFAEKDENIETEHQCPKCGYRWSGPSAAAPSGPDQGGEEGDE